MGAIVALALSSTTLAYIIYFRILTTAGAEYFLLATFLMPVIGVLFPGKTLDIRHFVSIALYSLGLAVINRRLPQL